MDENHIPERYFAAANTYHGFKSYFPIIFNPDEYDRIYVLKGGPGTGKSSFMRRFATDLTQKGCKTEEIYCSSDPRSLDGIIAIYRERKIAVIDGTAPHETDAKIPGAVDEIINLGVAWNSRWLTGERERISSTAKQKTEAYKSAYLSLTVAGTSSDAKRELLKNLYDVKTSKAKAKTLAERVFDGKCGIDKTRLISAFCKQGLLRLKSVENSCKNVFSIRGNNYACLRFLGDLYHEFKTLGAKITVCPTPLDPSLIEAIALPETATCFVIENEGEAIDVSDYLKNDELVREKLKCLDECHALALRDAERWFSVASELHFTLEDIYKRAMDFDIIDQIYEKKLAEACDILNLGR